MVWRQEAAAALEPSWKRAVDTYPLPMMIVDLERYEVVDANRAALKLFEQREGRVVTLGDHLKIAERHHHLIDLLASHALDGLETTVAAPWGRERTSELRVWVHALDEPGEPRRFAVAAMAEESGPEPAMHLATAVSGLMAVGAVDGEWVCQWVTREIKPLLGYERHDFIGTALLGLTHPDAAPTLVVALTHAMRGEGGSILTARLRNVHNHWRSVQVILSERPGEDGRSARGAMFLLLPGESQPPVLTTVSGGAGGPGGPGGHAEMLHRTVAGGRAADLARGGTWASSAGSSLPDLSSRQWEIVTRLRRGERVPGIARAMYLSQSTVRNHLTAVFRKFGVHSQEELLAVLREGE